MALIRPKEMRLHNQSRHINFYAFPFYGYRIAFAIHKPRIDIYSISKITWNDCCRLSNYICVFIHLIFRTWTLNGEQLKFFIIIIFFSRWHKFFGVPFIVFRQLVLAIKPFFMNWMKISSINAAIASSVDEMFIILPFFPPFFIHMT